MLAAIVLIASVAMPAGAQQPKRGNQAGREAKREQKLQKQQQKRTRQKANPEGSQKRGRPNRAAPLPAEVAAHSSPSVVLGRPTNHSVTANILSFDAREGMIEFGAASGKYDRKTNVFLLAAGVPTDVLLDRLPADQHVYYRILTRKPGETAFAAGAEFSFHTQRAPGHEFTFEIQGDSHPERPQMFDGALYAKTLRAAAADKPDFYMTIGDDFSIDTLPAVTPAAVNTIYLNQRLYLGLLAQSTPLFLVNGNHEQAAKYNLNGTSSSAGVIIQTTRNRFFPQPAPDVFYSGDSTPAPFIGPLRDYYAWTWGDALFVVIDFYWHTPTPVDNELGTRNKQRRDMWAITLGDEQYRWLKQTLEGSKAKYKFVFTHHVLGTGRGGAEEAGLGEWGGFDKKGGAEFAQRRPGWAMPIQQLMAKNGVTIFFQGHDHIFARQQLDGVVYQTLPLPADPKATLYNADAFAGDKLPGPGRVRVTVAPEKVSVDYVRTETGQIAFHYDVLPKSNGRN
ncbi:metallophosphoesterase [bacterium]|nr:metallophosphoesterase [bacterium]